MIIYDQIKEEKLKDPGFQMIRFTNNQIIYHWDKVEQDLSHLLA
ncbi:MAG: DUF559 domain-containing protein [Bacteroidetes bacterium]|nr:DUF559 domain-containing protein [Bacteroidota bacterium]